MWGGAFPDPFPGISWLPISNTLCIVRHRMSKLWKAATGKAQLAKIDNLLETEGGRSPANG